ncbi:MAG: hypothetical protein HYU99_05990, partial [Deltaproteobacteria bacterium]|nr:hypothetical protein [Deltaproteobacteria bacterium]
VKVFTTHSLETGYGRLVEITQGWIPGLAPFIRPGAVLFYIRTVIGLEAGLFLIACLAGMGIFVVWGYRSRFRFSEGRRLQILPFLAIVPLLLVWQWSGISRHGHHWYSFIFFPLLPLWIAVSMEAVASRLPPACYRPFQGLVLASVILLAPNSVMFDRSAFFILDDVVKDVREVKQELGYSKERYQKDVFFLDRLRNEGPGHTDPPFEFPSWGIYTDYLYGAVTNDIPSRESDPDRCTLVAHKPMVDFYSLDYYLKNIRAHFGIDLTRIHGENRLVFFEYQRPGRGNCFHNTGNAWVINEKMGLTMAKIPAHSQSILLKNEKQVDSSGRWIKQDFEFAVFDRKSSLPMVIRLSFQRNQEEIGWRATLESSQLMGHLNTMTAYAGLYRPWPRLWLEDVHLVLQGGDFNEILRFSDGEIGRFMLTPLTSVPGALTRNPDGKNLSLSFKYKTVVSGSYEESGADIQYLAKNRDKVQSWNTTQVLYEGLL